ncbi:unnamed protein product, partial [Rotaria sp. Silwood1]
MSSSESESGQNWSDDVEEDEEFAADDYFDDNYFDLDDTTYFSTLLDSLLEASEPGLPQSLSLDHVLDYRIRSAMNSANQSSSDPNESLSTFGDFLKTYLLAPPLNQEGTTSTNPYYLSYDLTTNTSTSNSLLSSQLFVGNIPHGSTWQQLKDYFKNLGYDVTRVDLKRNNISRLPGYAFVRFNSINDTTLALHDYERDPSKFVFCNNTLRLGRPKSSHSNTTSTTLAADNTPNTVDYNIADIYYGTLITGITKKNIRRGSSIVSSTDELGVIAHSLTPETNISSSFEIDLEKKKLAIIIKTSFDDFETYCSTSNELRFEWNFRDLKGKKIIPVLINHNINHDTKCEEVFLLVEIKRPPIILKKQYVDCIMFDQNDEIRLPGTALIGHANAWFFKLSSTKFNHDYMELFKILRRYNLTQKRFSEHNIIDLIRTIESARRNLESIELLSNDIWLEQNIKKVNNFLAHRWPSYPFETKFEIMKLISKHIITVHDLIVDDKVESILGQCSISTLIACTDKIVEHAPRWFSTTCGNDDEDWDKGNEEEEEANNSLIIIKDIPDDDSESIIPLHLRSSTGTTINVSHTEPVLTTIHMSKLSYVAKEHQLGTFSRLLLFALNELHEKHELRREPTTGMYITKHELRNINAHSFLIRKIYITPSSILYEGPYLEEKCAVTRHFEKYQERFLRVSFRDEDYSLLRNYNDNMMKIYERIKKILINGVTICDRKYEFLAFSSSQLREHSCWMFASVDGGVTVNTIHKWMGDFRDVHPVAKYAARLGQLFSTSIKGIQLEKSQFREISDVKRHDEYDRELCFTDGIGIIQPWFAEKLIKEVKPSNTNSCPSGFQIRCGGYKGMVCLNVANWVFDDNIDVYFRPSMRKFFAENFSIDVVRTSSNPSVAYLSRQIILLLSSLGIPDCVFLTLQDQMLQQLKELTGTPEKACQSLKDLNEFGGNGCHLFLIDYLRKLGKEKEPFARRILLAFQAFLIKELRTKARIRVPQSWSLLGVVDETRTLNYGQVFIQIDNSNYEGGSKEILQGPVVVTRSPCFHPGDIRRLEAVDVSALHELKNVIVFPINGDRPHAMEMSGGDLDGDTFWICQHPDLIFQTNEDPFDYKDQEIEAKKKAELHKNIQYTINDVCKFFGEYIEADNLGLIANSHLAFADQLQAGAKDGKCLKLARMHSVAVDFAKNGESADRLTKELRPLKYPHYMEKKDKPTYQSETILGKLYDEILSYKLDLNINKEEEIAATSAFPYASFFIDGHDVYMTDARVTKNEYDRELKRVMRQYGIKHEVELVSGYILKFNSKQYTKEKRIFELRNEITHAYRVIRDKYLRHFWEQFYQSINEESTDERQAETNIWPEVSKTLTWKFQYDLLAYYDRTSLYEEE